MAFKITQKSIQELCGTVSLKRGIAFYKANKVEIIEQNPLFCHAIVHASEPFQVQLEMADEKNLITSCSCPTLTQFTLKCQHVAAVLHALEMSTREQHAEADDILAIFKSKAALMTVQQQHFEKRKLIDISYILKPKFTTKDDFLWAIQLRLDEEDVVYLYDFLQAVKKVQKYKWYDPQQHCFRPEDDAILQYLIQTMQDELLYKQQANTSDNLTIPPTVWPNIAPLLMHSPQIELMHPTRKYYQFAMRPGQPPLHFEIREQQENILLSADGFEQILVSQSYSQLLVEDTIYSLSLENCQRYVQMKQLFQEKSAIQIPFQQFEQIMNEIVPGLRKIGQVKLSKKLQLEFNQAPLQAHLYLDRLHNKLLVGVEFHYGQVAVQPFEERVSPLSLVRDLEQERSYLEVFEAAGFSQSDGGYYMQNEELEYHFLMHILPKLQKQMKVYATTAVRLRVTKNTVFPRIRVKVQKERTNWVDFTFELEGIRDEQIQEVLAAIKIKQKYYRLPNGSLLSLETKEIEEIQRFLNEVPIQDDGYEASFDLPITEALRFMDFFEDSDVFAIEQSFQQVTDRLLHPEQIQFEVPKMLAATLRDYQQQGFQWLKLLASYGFGGILADDMGLGKSLQSIAFIVSELEIIRAQKQPVLIVCPSSLTYNWQHECRKFAPMLRTIIVDGDAKNRREVLQNIEEVDVVITSYPLLRRDILLYMNTMFHTVFFDEAQAFKNPTTQTARTVKKLEAQHKFALTGTPMENALEELWSIYRVVFPQLLGTLEEFSHLQNKDVARRVKPFLLRRMKEHVLEELPEKVEWLERSELLTEQKKLYAAYLAKLRHDTLKHLDKETFRLNKVRILAGITRLRQLCCHPALFIDGYQGSSAKFDQLFSILQEAKVSGRRVLIFSQFTQMLKMIAAKLSEQNEAYYYLDGQTAAEERLEMCQQFNEGNRDIFLISLKAGGTGLNLTGADTVILYDLWWNPAVEEQAADRAHRMGQQKSVQVIKMVAKGTIEEKMYELQEKKRDLIANILHPSEQLTTLSEDDIKEILQL